MRQVIESLRRLHQKGIVNKEKVFELFESKKISEEELRYILEVNQAL